MIIKKILSVLLLLLLASCTCFNNIFNNDLDKDYERQKAKLFNHFSGKQPSDISALIHETAEVSSRLKSAGMIKKANKLDSCVDVLMFGNHTIDESLNDVMKLVRCKNF